MAKKQMNDLMTNEQLKDRFEELELRVQVLENKILDGGVKPESSDPPPPPPPPPHH